MLDSEDSMALKEKLERLRRNDSSSDPAVTLSEWQDAVRTLLDDVEKWLAPFIAEGLMRPQRTIITLDEEDLGPYSVERLDLELGRGAELVLLPIARFVAGATGRVDLYAKGRMYQGYMLLRHSRTMPLALAADGKTIIPQPEVVDDGWAMWRMRPEGDLGALAGLGFRSGQGTPLNAASLEAAIDALLD